MAEWWRRENWKCQLIRFIDMIPRYSEDSRVIIISGKKSNPAGEVVAPSAMCTPACAGGRAINISSYIMQLSDSDTRARWGRRLIGRPRWWLNIAPAINLVAVKPEGFRGLQIWFSLSDDENSPRDKSYATIGRGLRIAAYNTLTIISLIALRKRSVYFDPEISRNNIATNIFHGRNFVKGNQA